MELIELFYNLKENPSELYESEILEFKRYKDSNSFYNSKDFCDEICALANTFGGKIIVGIVDSKEIKDGNFKNQLVGFEIVDLNITKERINGKIKPKLDLKIYYFNFENKNFLVVEVAKNKNSIVSTASGKIFIREGNSSMPAEPYQIQQLVSNLQSYDWSNQDIDKPNSSELLNPDAVLSAKIDFCKRRGLFLEDLDDNSFLESIGATKNGILNHSGLLFL